MGKCAAGSTKKDKAMDVPDNYYGKKRAKYMMTQPIPGSKSSDDDTMGKITLKNLQNHTLDLPYEAPTRVWDK